MAEESRGHPPQGTSLFDGGLFGSLGLLSVDYLVEVGSYVATSQPLQLLTPVHQEVSIWHLHFEFFPVVEPSVQPRETRFAMDSQQIEVLVERSDHLAGLEFFQTEGRRREVEHTVFYRLSEIGFLKAEADR